MVRMAPWGHPVCREILVVMVRQVVRVAQQRLMPLLLQSLPTRPLQMGAMVVTAVAAEMVLMAVMSMLLPTVVTAVMGVMVRMPVPQQAPVCSQAL